MYKNTQVLIVEDQFLVSEMIAELVEEIGYRVVGKAADGQQALDMVQSLHPDVVLMDIDMPGMDGIEATRRIQEICPVPVVILTAFETPELVERASQVGVGAYLIKLPNGREMERAITIAIARFGDMRELRRLNAELQARNEELDTFAHTVAHDLQNMVGLIIGYISLLREEKSLVSDLRRYVDPIARNADKMGTVIDELQLLAGVRKAQVQLRPLDMSRIVTEARQRLAYMIDEYQAQLSYPEVWPPAYGHAPWVEEVWINYLSNAIKYGGQPPLVELGATRCSDGMVRFWVRDNGPGLKPGEQVRLFTPFTRLDQIHVTGHGLGLSIVRRIIDRLGGQVGVESEGLPGQGSIFSFTLPAVEPARG